MGNGQTERSGENHLMTTTFVGRDFEETRKTGEIFFFIVKKPGKRERRVEETGEV
jgi:hypothetical protein